LLLQKEANSLLNSKVIPTATTPVDARIFPNPITNASFNILFDNKNDGIYTVVMSDLTGRSMMTKKVSVTSGVQTQGNDDFVLYMQHQQGPAGATGIVKALEGTGKMASDTVATKKGTKYANLVMNVPSDRPQVKSNIIKALDKGDQKTAAGLFLSMWKEKWVSKQKQAKIEIEKPKNATVKSAIKKYSAMYKVPFDFAITVAMIESGLNPKSGNATYKGLYAMVPTSNYNGATFAMGAKWADPEVNANAGIKLLAHDITLFRKGLGSTVHALNLGDWSANLA
jgi:hypothetical protein